MEIWTDAKETILFDEEIDESEVDINWSDPLLSSKPYKSKSNDGNLGLVINGDISEGPNIPPGDDIEEEDLDEEVIDSLAIDISRKIRIEAVKQLKVNDLFIDSYLKSTNQIDVVTTTFI